MPLIWATMSRTSTPERRARDTRRPMASALAVMERPDLPMVAKTSKGLPSISLTVRYMAPRPVWIFWVKPCTTSGRLRTTPRRGFSAGAGASPSIFFWPSPVASTCRLLQPSRYTVTPLQPSL